MQSRVYKNKIFCIFLVKYLHMSQKSSIFAPVFKNKIINN